METTTYSNTILNHLELTAGLIQEVHTGELVDSYYAVQSLEQVVSQSGINNGRHRKAISREKTVWLSQSPSFFCEFSTQSIQQISLGNGTIFIKCSQSGHL